MHDSLQKFSGECTSVSRCLHKSVLDFPLLASLTVQTSAQNLSADRSDPHNDGRGTE
jgi:hypothetical protein